MKRSMLVLVVILVTTGSACADLIGVTGTDLVRINPTNPSQITTIGPINLPTGITPYALAYNSATQRLFGLGISNTPFPTSHLIEYSLQTGQSTVLANLGDQRTGFYEALEYVDSLNSLVASQDRTGTPSDRLFRLNPDGSTSLLTTVSRDNDFAVYDSTRDIFYTTDPNTVGQLVRVNLASGSTQDLGPIPSVLGELAYSPEEDVIFGLDFTNRNLYRVSTTNGIGPITTTIVGTTGNVQVLAIAFVPSGTVVPEPSSVLLLGLGAFSLAAYLHRRRSPLRASLSSM